MKLITILFSVFLFGCDSPSSVNRNIPEKAGETLSSKQADSLLLVYGSDEILRSIKERDYKKLVSYIHPVEGIRFSPSAYIDTIHSIKLSREDLILLAKQNRSINWNTSWEEDKPELMTIDQYFKKFVYDVDFLNAELKSLNKFHSQGTDQNNISKVYPGCDVVEYFFSGFEKQYEGMDFRSLRLVFKWHRRIGRLPYLVAIVHDQWTP